MKKELQLYDRGRKCPKCKNWKVADVYISKQIKRTCQNCSYEWIEMPLDIEEKNKTKVTITGCIHYGLSFKDKDTEKLFEYVRLMREINLELPSIGSKWQYIIGFVVALPSDISGWEWFDLAQYMVGELYCKRELISPRKHKDDMVWLPRITEWLAMKEVEGWWPKKCKHPEIAAAKEFRRRMSESRTN